MKYAIVDSSGVIANIVIAEPNDIPPDGCTFEPIGPDVYCNPGELWSDRQYIPSDSSVVNTSEVTP